MKWVAINAHSLKANETRTRICNSIWNNNNNWKMNNLLWWTTILIFIINNNNSNNINNTTSTSLISIHLATNRLLTLNQNHSISLLFRLKHRYKVFYWNIKPKAPFGLLTTFNVDQCLPSHQSSILYSEHNLVAFIRQYCQCEPRSKLKANGWIECNWQDEWWGERPQLGSLLGRPLNRAASPLPNNEKAQFFFLLFHRFVGCDPKRIAFGSTFQYLTLLFAFILFWLMVNGTNLLL